VALGAGSSKGYAHIGVLSALERRGVPIDYIAGASIGAAAASLLALGSSPGEMIEYLDQIGSRLFRPTVPVRGLLSNIPLRKRLQTAIGADVRIEDLPLPLAIVAADLVERREVVFRSGLLWPAVLASVSIPGIYPATRIGRYTLVDGGALNPVPSDVVAGMGADVVIAVKLSGRLSEGDRQEAVAVEPAGTPPQVLEVLTRSIELMQSRIATQTARATVTISPRCNEGAGDGIRGFTRGRRFVELGGQAAEGALPRLAAALPWLRETGQPLDGIATPGTPAAAPRSVRP
jgi:NTE family protein